MRRLFPLCLGLALLGAPPARLDAPKGTLVIVGGGGFPDDVREAFLQACGGPGAVIGIIPSASSEPAARLAEWKADLAKAHITLVPLDIRRRAQSDDPALLKAASRCTGFWFSGGDQSRIGDWIVGTRLHDVLRQRYAEGAAVGGTSAGAAIMSQTMLTGEDRQGKETLADLAPGAYRTRPGMGFLPSHCVVDQHFLRRNRQNRLFSILLDHPGALGLGIDEATALVVKDGQARVLGERAVMVFDGQGMASQVPGTFRDLRLHLLRKGQGIDLATRALLP